MTRWTDEEVEWLRANFATAPWPEMEARFGRRRDAIYTFANGVMGLSKKRTRDLPWTDDDVKALVAAGDSRKRAMELLPMRSADAISWKAKQLGIRFKAEATSRRKPHREAVVAALGTGSYTEIGRRFGISRGAVCGIAYRHRHAP